MTGVLGWPTIAMEREMNQSRFDITDRRDVAYLVNVFYDRVRDDDILGPIFDDIAHVDWATHLPRMYDFWESVLFARGTFKGAPLVVHRALARRTPLTAAAFDASTSSELARIRSEYIEMPGLVLTLPQAARLWGFGPRRESSVRPKGNVPAPGKSAASSRAVGNESSSPSRTRSLRLPKTYPI